VGPAVGAAGARRNDGQGSGLDDQEPRSGS
jgi:hypothetical protein